MLFFVYIDIHIYTLHTQCLAYIYVDNVYIVDVTRDCKGGRERERAHCAYNPFQEDRRKEWRGEDRQRGGAGGGSDERVREDSGREVGGPVRIWHIEQVWVPSDVRVC